MYYVLSFISGVPSIVGHYRHLPDARTRAVEEAKNYIVRDVGANHYRDTLNADDLVKPLADFAPGYVLRPLENKQDVRYEVGIYKIEAQAGWMSTSKVVTQVGTIYVLYHETHKLVRKYETDAIITVAKPQVTAAYIREIERFFTEGRRLKPVDLKAPAAEE